MQTTRAAFAAALAFSLAATGALAESPPKKAMEPKANLWHQYYFLTERGRAGLEANRRDLARILWKNNSPAGHFDDAVFERAAEAFDNPDYVDVVIHSYRHRLGHAAAEPLYDEAKKKLALQPLIAVPSITLEGSASGIAPADDTVHSLDHLLARARRSKSAV